MRTIRSLLALLAIAVGAFMASSSCAGEKLTGEVKIDGSSTVFLISEAVAANFKKQHPDVNISVGISGTGGGMKKFSAGEIDICDASRKMKPAEADKCRDKGIAFIELQVGWDGLAVVIHKDNTWATKMSLEQLKKIWHPESAAKKWSDVDPSWPNETIKLYGAGPDSGTFDFFTEAVNGKEKVSRTDYVASEDDNNLVQGVSRNKYSLGYFGVAYYDKNKDNLGVVSLSKKTGEKSVEPTKVTVLTQEYPISRPLFIYVAKDALKRRAVAAFCEFYLRRSDLVSNVGYIELTVRGQQKSQSTLKAALSK